jgi:hypothetical protein
MAKRPAQVPLPSGPDPSPLYWPCVRCGVLLVVADPTPTPTCEACSVAGREKDRHVGLQHQQRVGY